MRFPSLLPSNAALDALALLRTGALRPLSVRTTAAVAGRVLREGLRPDLIYTINATQDPHRLAIVHDNNVLSWGRLYSRILRLANWCLDHRVRPGDPIAVVLGNRPEFVETQAAAVRIGALASFVNPKAPAESIKAIFDRLQPALVVTDRPEITGGRPSLLVGQAYEAALAASHDAEPRVPHGASGQVVMFTSGTTGVPKGAVRGFGRSLSTSSLGFLRVLPFRRDDVHLAVAPLYHATGSGFLTIAQALGSPAVMLERFSPEAFCRAVQDWRVTTTAVVPTMLHELCRWSKTSDYDLSSLRIVVCTGSKLPSSLRDEARELLGDVLYDLYGATEMAWVSVAGPRDIASHPGSVGRPVPGVQVEIRDADGHAVPAGALGEIWARNALSMDGYLKDEELTADRKRDGFVSVRDVGYLDGDGYLHVVDRADDMIISGGENVYPAEVELELQRHPRVAEVSVIGLPDAKWGQRIVAAVVASGSVDGRELLAWARQHLPPHAVPKDVAIVGALPKSETGKVLRRELAHNWSSLKTKKATTRNTS